jgi:hypothetical protein
MRNLLQFVCLVFMPVFCHAASAQAPLSVSFPVIASYNLEKTKVTLPADFQGQVNLIILTFESEQQKDADTWTPVVKSVEASRPGLHHYLLPVYGKENFLYRWWINSSLRSSLPADEQRQTTIPLYLNRPTFMKSLNISSDKEITVLLVDKQGRVLWREMGELNDAKRSSLQAALLSAGRADH